MNDKLSLIENVDDATAHIEDNHWARLIIDQIADVRKNFIRKRIDEYDSLINSTILPSYKIYCNDIELHKKDGHLFNVFTLWNRYSGISETIHSRLLHFLLSPDELHGQGNLFLCKLLERLNVFEPDKGNWKITAEVGRVDVMLKRSSPESVIIIENKSNWATDQGNQLYRYWYQNIYNLTGESNSDFYIENSARYKVLYLAPCENKVYSDNTRNKPSQQWFTDITEEQYRSLPDVMPITPTCATFDNDIIKWLNDCIQSLDESNAPLKLYINQYMKYCKTL